MIRRFLMIILLAITTVPLAGCNKTTLDKIGAGVLTGVRVFKTELDGLLAKKQISPEKHAGLTAKADALGRESTAYRDLIAGFPKITRDNVGQVLSATTRLIVQFRTTLTDPDLGGVAADSKAIATLSYTISILEASAGALEILFPPRVITPAGATIPSREYRSSEIEIKIPPKPKGL